MDKNVNKTNLAELNGANFKLEVWKRDDFTVVDAAPYCQTVHGEQ